MKFTNTINQPHYQCFIMTKNSSQCLLKFKKELRRSDLEQIKTRKRNQILNVISKQYIIDQFQKALDSKDIMTLSSILSNCKNILINPIPSQNIIVDQRQLVPIESHISLYRHIYLESHQCAMHDLIAIVFQIIGRYSSLQIHQYAEYQAQFYKLISIVIDKLGEGQRQKIIGWVENKESIWLIKKVINQIGNVTCKSYPNVFKIIVDALGSQNQCFQADAVLLLAKIIKYSQKIDLFYIHQQFFCISELIVKIISRRLNRNQTDLINFWTPLIQLFSTFDEAIIKYAQTGIIDVCGQLIATSEQSNIFGALQILNILCQVHQQKMILLLLKDQNTSGLKSWIDQFLSNRLFLHSNLRIRKSFVKLVKNVMKRANLNQLRLLCNKFALAGCHFLVYLQGLLSLQDWNTQLLALQCVQILLFQQRGMGKQYYQEILFNLQSHSIIKQIYILHNHKNQQIQQLCRDILGIIDQIRNNQVYQI